MISSSSGTRLTIGWPFGPTASARAYRHWSISAWLLTRICRTRSGRPVPGSHTGCPACTGRTFRWRRGLAAEQAPCAARSPLRICQRRNNRIRARARDYPETRPDRKPQAEHRPRAPARRASPGSAIGPTSRARREQMNRCDHATEIRIEGREINSPRAARFHRTVNQAPCGCRGTKFEIAELNKDRLASRFAVFYWQEMQRALPGAFTGNRQIASVGGPIEKLEPGPDIALRAGDQERAAAVVSE